MDTVVDRLIRYAKVYSESDYHAGRTVTPLSLIHILHESVLARRFYDTVRTIPGVNVYGTFAVQLRAPIVSLNIADLDSSEVADELAERFEIATRPGAHCAPRLHRALGTEDQGAVRFSWSYFNTEAETDAAAEAVRILAAEAV